MAMVFTSTGSQWQIGYGVDEDVVNWLMISGVGPGNIVSAQVPTSGAWTVLYQK